MLADARAVPDGEVIDAGVCVIGAGPVGLTLALELGQRGLDVCLLERGGSDRIEPLDGDVTGEPFPPLASARASGVGGTAALWRAALPRDTRGARLVPLEPIDFEQRADVPSSGWPFDRAHLEPYYERASTLAGFGTYDGDPRQWEDPPRLVQPKLGDAIQTGIFRFGLKTVFTQDARASIERSPEVRCYLNAHALELETEDGRVTGVRAASEPGRSFRVRARVVLLALGGIENARLLLLSDVGNEQDLVGRSLMDHPTLRASLVLSSPRAATRLALCDLVRKDGRLAMGYLALSEEVRRREGLLSSGFIVVPSRPRSERGFAALDAIRARNAGPADFLRAALAADAIALGATRKLAIRVPAVGRAARIWPSFGLLNTHGIGHVAGWSRLPLAGRRFHSFDVYQVIEQPPELDRRVTLGARRDGFGRPLPSLHWFVSERELTSALRTQRLLATELARAELGRLVTTDELAPSGEVRELLHPSAHHHLGTTRMSADPRQGVVDVDGRVHGSANLFVAGTSVFPTSGFVNPSLTAVALALRLADHVAATFTALPD
jgi:choline dehydrogenase-like flavoprotein